MIPFFPEQLLEINDDPNPVFDSGILFVDNWYKNFEYFRKIVYTLPAARWKWSTDSRNFKDYYDCRSRLSHNLFDANDLDCIKVIKQYIRAYFEIEQPVNLVNDPYEFNLYRNIKKDIPQHLQHFPHTDQEFNCIVYFDDVCSGGTAIYNLSERVRDGEDVNMLYDISKFQFEVIKAVPNRLVIFPGRIDHGGYIEDHNKYLDKWRINQVMFFNPSV